MLGIGVLYSQLALGIGAHGIDKLLRCDEDGVRGAAGDLGDWDVVRAETRDHMDLTLITDLFSKTKLSEAV